ncbi:MAG: prolyl oligopeptidase family serine peptidase, partial [Moheibacter sp.]
QHYAFPNQFLNIQSILSKLIAESGELHIKPEFGMIGTSAGAHLAMMYDYQYDTDDLVKMVADIVGPTDFTDPFYEEHFDLPTAVQNIVDQDAYPPGTEYLVELSPITHAGSSSSPTCMFYGTEDPLVPATNGTALQQKLNQAGVDNTLRIYQGGHGNDWSNQDLIEAQGIISDYITTYLP